MAKPAKYVADAPARLTALFADAGFRVRLLVTRSSSLPTDPGAFLLPADEPFDPRAKNDVDRMVKAYEVDDE